MIYWLIVADAAHARVISTEGPHKPLHVEREMANPAGRAHVHDLVSDQAGRYAKGGRRGIKSALEPRTSPHEMEEKRLAHGLAEFLEIAREQGRYERLVLIAPPKFLGVLRLSLSPLVRKHLARAVAKDLTKIELEDLCEHIKEVFEPPASAAAAD